jgi:hypothetical protein
MATRSTDEATLVGPTVDFLLVAAATVTLAWAATTLLVV